MIKGMMKTNEGKDIILLGISRENILRLKEGKPIHVKGDELGVSQDIFIMYGDTEMEIYNELKPMMGAETRVINDINQTIQ